MPRLGELRAAGESFRHFDTGEALKYFESAGAGGSGRMPGSEAARDW